MKKILAILIIIVLTVNIKDKKYSTETPGVKWTAAQIDSNLIVLPESQ